MIRDGRHRALGVIADVETLRERFPLLCRPLSARALAHVLQELKVAVLLRPIEQDAYVVGVPPSFTIVIKKSLSPRMRVAWAAHELAHIRLHYDGEIVKQLSPCAPDDPRELEAKLFARMLLLGEIGTPDHPRVAPIVAALVAGEHRRRLPRQLPLELPEPMPRVLTSADLDWEDEIAHRQGKNRQRASLPDARRVQLAGAKDPFTARFVDRDGRIWWIYDRGERRVFYHSVTTRRIYRFGAGEIRALKAKHLDRQLREAAIYSPATRTARTDHAIR